MKWNQIGKKQKIIGGLIVVVAIAGAGAWVWWANYNSGPKIEVHEFAGQIVSINGNKITMNGAFVATGQSLPKNETTEVVVSVSDDTKITKTLLYIPTKAELEKTGGLFYPDKLKKDYQDVSLDTLKTDGASSGLTVKSAANIYGKNSFSASEISYTQPVFP
jgi:hypothetical protein